MTSRDGLNHSFPLSKPKVGSGEFQRWCALYTVTRTVLISVWGRRRFVSCEQDRNQTELRFRTIHHYDHDLWKQLVYWSNISKFYHLLTFLYCCFLIFQTYVWKSGQYLGTELNYIAWKSFNLCFFPGYLLWHNPHDFWQYCAYSQSEHMVAS